jgi:hypothetical protein
LKFGLQPPRVHVSAGVTVHFQCGIQERTGFERITLPPFPVRSGFKEQGSETFGAGGVDEVLNPDHGLDDGILVGGIQRQQTFDAFEMRSTFEAASTYPHRSANRRASRIECRFKLADRA